MSDKPEIENKTVQDDNTQKYLLNDFNEIPAQDDQMHTICNQNTTQYKTLELKVENKDTCTVINEKTIPPKVHLKPVLDQYEPLILRKEQNTTNETVKISIEEDNRIAVNTKENDLQNKNIAENAEDGSIKNKLEPITVTEKRIGEWVFMYQQPQPYYPPPQYPPPQYPPPQYEQSLGDPEPVGDPIGGAYDSSRNFFVLLVFSICGVMLFITFCFVTFTLVSEDFEDFARSKMGTLILYGCMFVALMISYAFACCDCARGFPVNFVLVAIATLVYSYIAAYAASKYAPIIVAGAAGTTCVIVILCACLAMTSFDFTRFILVVAVGMMAMFVASLITVVLSKVLGVKLTIMQIVLTAISSALTSVMLVIELQMILGGKSVELGEDEYVYGAYLIYTSIITLFLQILRLLGLIMGDND